MDRDTWMAQNGLHLNEHGAPVDANGVEHFQPNDAFELLDAVSSSDHVAHQSDDVLG
ncbi:hypothetical protein [Kitasatospora sp. NPDC004289]